MGARGGEKITSLEYVLARNAEPELLTAARGLRGRDFAWRRQELNWPGTRCLEGFGFSSRHCYLPRAVNNEARLHPSLNFLRHSLIGIAVDICCLILSEASLILIFVSYRSSLLKLNEHL